MAYVTLPYPRLDRGATIPGIVDPDEVNENFKEIARVLNGNIGAENLASARGIAGNVLSAQRSIHGISLDLRTYLHVWPANGQLFKFRALSRLVACSISTSTSWTTAFGPVAGFLKAGPQGGPYTSMMDLSDPLAGAGTSRASYLVTDVIGGGEIASGDILVLNLGAGGNAIAGLTVYVTELHQAPP